MDDDRVPFNPRVESRFAVGELGAKSEDITVNA
jgi:hypothetical protein